ncbi:MAG: PAS domain-containing protein [Planctomycetota bacterium]|nr:PAS domain-containing protein [Planctomycetota bacterium]
MEPEDPSKELERLRREVAQLTAQSVPASPMAQIGQVFDEMFEGIQIVDFDWRYVYLNASAGRHSRRAREELIGRTMQEMYPGIEQAEVFAYLRRAMTERIPQQVANLFTFPDGHKGWFDIRISPVPMGILILSVDISTQKEIEEDLRRSREDLAITLECMAEGVITTDTGGGVAGMNPAAERLTGWPTAEARGQSLDRLVRFLNQETGEAVDHPVAKVLSQGLKIGLANDTVLVARDGSRVPIASSGAPIRDASGRLRGAVVVLKNMKEEYELAAMLRQAQKMESVGQLAGGIAHDFNNLLTVINGYSALSLQRLPDGDALRGPLESIGEAGERAAALTRQLLAFSRKQVLKPELLDLNEVVRRTSQMLKRLIGEDVELSARLKPGLGAVRFDPGQIEQILMNLAVNARDAMPKGGKLTIETANVELDAEYARTHPGAQAGPHVMIAVSDTGVGMEAATKARIFEPFFTTKAPGKGTGLGLSTVYGIVKQSGGNIWVYSEPGRGTAFKVYLPRAEAKADNQGTKATHSGAPGVGTILVVEDEEGVRTLLRDVLEMGGYTVLTAGDAAVAQALCAKHQGEIRLLLTDVVLPGMGGRELSEKLVAMRPGMRVVFMSGYTDNAIVHHGVLEPGLHFIEKPILPNVLLDKIGAFLAT